MRNDADEPLQRRPRTLHEPSAPITKRTPTLKVCDDAQDSHTKSNDCQLTAGRSKTVKEQSCKLSAVHPGMSKSGGSFTSLTASTKGQYTMGSSDQIRCLSTTTRSTTLKSQVNVYLKERDTNPLHSKLRAQMAPSAPDLSLQTSNKIACVSQGEAMPLDRIKNAGSSTLTSKTSLGDQMRLSVVSVVDGNGHLKTPTQLRSRRVS